MKTPTMPTFVNHKEREVWYLKHRGLRCPFCGDSQGLICGEKECEADEISVPVACTSCKQEWTDEYQLKGLTEQTK